MKANRQFWRIFGIFLFIVTLLGIFFLLASSITTRKYFMEANQKLNGGIAEQMVKEVKPFVNGEVDTTAMQDIMHSMMVINPSVEVYLLDEEGNIITYVAPYKRVVREKIDLDPIKSFIRDGGNRSGCYLGEDPRQIGGAKVFSAAEIHENDALQGYMYIILASEDQVSALASLKKNLFLQLGVSWFLASLILSLLLGGILLWSLLRGQRKIVAAVNDFTQGDYRSRIPADAGDFKNLALQFNEMADQVENNIESIKRHEKLRRELIANVSHDLRTPLSVIRGYTETLLLKKDKLDDESITKYLNVIHDSSTNLSNMVQQLFELSKLEAKDSVPVKEAFSIADLANDLILKNKLRADGAEIDLSLNSEQGLPLVYADIAMVERVFQNLIDNALKFTKEQGKVLIELTSSEEHIKCVIADSGIGIAAEDQEMIFDRYRRSSNEVKSSENSGGGLGLTIVKKILDLHETTIHVKSKIDEGTSFIFKLPIQPT